MARRAIEISPDSRLRPADTAPVSSCCEHWASLLQQRQLRPPQRVGTLARIGRFEILKELGTGGMGIVFLARDPLGISAQDPSSASGCVAVKVPRPELAGDPRARDRFLTEARHLQQFDHPHILKVLELHASSEQPYLVMPHLRHGNLAQHLRHRGPLPDPEVLALGLQVASALLHAHKHGIIHRDLKPANVLLDDQGRAVLTDFGLARSVFNESVTDITREHREGTVPYMSPAVARGEAEDTRCDVYAFGALLYEMLTGRPPYSGSSPADITHQILSRPPRPILALRPQASPRLARVAEWAMARELRQRYAHMIDVIADLQRIETGLMPAGPHASSDPLPAPRKPNAAARPFALGLSAGALALILGASLLPTVRRAGGSHPVSDHVPPPRQADSATPQSHRPQPWFLLHGQELLMLEAAQNSQVRMVHRFFLPWLPSMAGHEPAGRVQVDWLSDVDHDGLNELVLRTAAPTDSTFTSLACFDVQSERLRWNRHDPRGFLPPALIDPEEDGRREVLLITPGQDGDPPEARLLTLDGHSLGDAVPWTEPIPWHRPSYSDGRGWELHIEDSAAQWLTFASRGPLNRPPPAAELSPHPRGLPQSPEPASFAPSAR